jgi:hypothetical protein
MTSLLYGIIVAALLSITSLLVVLFRVSPLTSPTQALPSFFASMFLSIASVTTLLLYLLWKNFPLHAWDEGKVLSISVRQGLFIASGVLICILFHLLGLLTWWIAILIFLVFLLVELALHY